MFIRDKRMKHSLSNKMTICFSALFIVAVMFLIVFYYQRTINDINKEAILLMKNKLDNQSVMYDVFMQSNDQMSISFRTDYDFMKILTDDSPSASDLDYIETELSNYYASQNNIEDVQFYIPASRTIVTWGITKGRTYSRVNVEMEENAFLTYGKLAMQSPKKRFVFADWTENGDVRQSFYYCRVLFDIPDEIVGVLLIHFDRDFYQKIIKDGMTSETLFSGVFDSNNQPILISSNEYYDDNFSMITDVLDDEINEDGYVTYFDKQSIIMVKSALGTKHILVFSKLELQRENIVVAYQSGLLLMIIVCFFIVLIRSISNGITRPIIQLAEQMKNIDVDNPAVRIDGSHDDEIGYLTRQFVGMLGKIDTLIDEKYVSAINENNARMKALQAQINPHFLYNSLQVISTQAMLSENWTIVEMVDALSNTYRYSVKVGDAVTVMQEKNNLENFLSINKHRYEEQLNYSVDIDRAIEGFIVPKFALQILAENAIKHGMNENVLNLKLEVKKIGEKIAFRAVDNGNGFDQRKKEKLLSQIRENQMEQSETHGLGLRNLYERFGNMYGLENVNICLSSSGGETIVEYLISIKKEVSIND